MVWPIAVSNTIDEEIDPGIDQPANGPSKTLGERCEGDLAESESRLTGIADYSLM